MFREDVDDLAVHPDRTHGPLSPTAAQFGASDVGYSALIPTIICTVFATIVVALRWYTRARLVRCIGMDDCVILLSLFLAWTMSIIIGISVAEGVGSYNGELHVMNIAKLIVANNSVWTILVNVTKASILTQYLRIFSGTKTRALCYLLLSTLLPAACWGIFGGIFLCEPTSKLWNPEIPGHCRNAQTYWVSVAAVDIFLDFAILILPIPAIAALRLPPRQKMITLLAFVLGFSVCAVSVVRLATVVITAQMGDFIMSGIWSIIWSAVEANVGIICASLLSMKHLLTTVWPGLLEEPHPPRHATQLPHVLPAVEQADWSFSDEQTPTLWCEGSSLPKSSKKRSSSCNEMWTRVPSAFPPSRRRIRTRHAAADSVGGGVMDIMEILRQDEEAMIRGL